MTVVWAMLLTLVLLAGWVLTLVGMPGNWLMVAAAAVYSWFVPDASPRDVGWAIVGVLLLLACLGELLEMLAGMLGAAKAGGSKRSALLALAGSVIGGVAGIFVGTPIPVVGQVVAALLLAGVGALAGAMLGEIWKGRTMQQSWRVGQAAFWGRLLGTLAKSLVASVMVVLAVAAMLL
jgi:hypothetical protein